MSKSGFSGQIVVTIFLCAVACDQTSAEKPQESAQSSRSAERAPLEAKDQTQLYPALKESVTELIADFDGIAEDRKNQLKKLALFVETKQSSGETAEITFICTHNSRRSHLSQLWAATAAAHYGVEGVKTYSGGTEATAFNSRAVAAVERAGFQVQKPPGASENPHYEVKYAADAPAQECFSKKYDDSVNPASGFAAVMTCSQADQNCPLVQGAALRVALPFVDPKESDGTPEEAATYDERSRQIGTEMLYLFSLVKQKG